MVKVLTLPSKTVEVHPAVHDINMYAVQGNARRNFHAAIVAAKRALRVTPNSREMWVNIGTFYFNTQQYDEAEAAFQRSAMLDPNFAMAHVHLGLVCGATGRFDEAEQHYANAEQIQPSLTISWDRALLKLRRGNYADGFKEFESRIPHRPHAFPKYPMPYYNGEPLADKTVYVPGEQGIGDTILFSRFLPWLCQQGCRKILVHVDAPMTNLLWGFRDRVEFMPHGVPLPKADYVISIGSLAHWSGVTLNTLPPDPGDILRRVQASPDFDLPEPGGPDAFRVGIAWSGNPLMDRNEERSIPLRTMARVAENPLAWVHSFQCGEASGDIARDGFDGLVLDLSEQMMARGLVGCGAAMLKMDLVITSCTSIAHLAGALGVPCWVMLCYDCYWPWMVERLDSPWYPRTKLFRQRVPGDWNTVMDEVLGELDSTLERRNLRHG